jgi:hypothetical protein
MKIGILSDFEIGIRVLKMQKLAHEPIHAVFVDQCMIFKNHELVHKGNGLKHVKSRKILTLF